MTQAIDPKTWTVRPDPAKPDLFAVCGKYEYEPREFCQVWVAREIGLENAKLLIRIANAHYDLLAACEAALIKINRTPIDKLSVAADMLRNAIAKAKGGG